MCQFCLGGSDSFQRFHRSHGNSSSDPDFQQGNERNPGSKAGGSLTWETQILNERPFAVQGKYLHLHMLRLNQEIKTEV